MTGRPAWWWTLAVGAVALIISGLFLVTIDTTGALPVMARDIRITGGVSIAGGIAVAVLMDAAGHRRTLRWVLAIIVAFTVAVPMLGIVSGAVTPWPVLPAAVLTVGMLLLFRDVAKGDQRATGGRGGAGVR